MTDFKKKFEIEGLVNMKTDQAEAQLRRLEERAKRTGAGGGLPGTPETASTRAAHTLQAQFGQDFSFLQNRRAINALIRQEHQTVRDLAEAYNKVKTIQTDTGKAQAAHLQRQISDHRMLAQAMRSVQMVGEASETDGKQPGWRALVVNQLTQRMTFNQAMRGGMFSQMGQAAMSHPRLAMAAGGIGALAYLGYKAVSAGEGFEPIEQAYTNVQRGTQAPHSMLYALQQPGTAAQGRIRDSLLKLGYTHRDAASMLQGYSIPGSTHDTRNAIEAQADFARRTGFGEHPEAISGLGRHVAMMGLPVGKQQDFWREMFGLTLSGNTAGNVDATETLKSMITLLGKIADNTGQLTPERMEAALQTSLRFRHAGRIFQGEAGTARLGSMLQSFEQPQSIQGQAMLNNILMTSFGGKIPSGKELGLDEARAVAFDRMVPTQQLAFIRQNMTSLKGGVAGTIFSGLNASVPPALQGLMYQSMRGINESQAVEEMAGFARALTGGTNSPGSSGVPFKDLGILFGAHEGKSVEGLLAMLRSGQTDQQARDPLTAIERNLASKQAGEELKGKAGSDATLWGREMANAFILQMTEWLSSQGYKASGFLESIITNGVGKAVGASSASDVEHRLFPGRRLDPATP